VRSFLGSVAADHDDRFNALFFQVADRFGPAGFSRELDASSGSEKRSRGLHNAANIAGAELAKQVLGRLRSSAKLRDYVAALVRHHLDAGFLVHERPLDRRTVWRYLQKTRPYSADVTLFTVADRLATRGANAGPAIEAHLDVAQTLIAAAREPAQRPLLRGDELIRAGVAPGPKLGTILAQLEEDRFAGAIVSREDALARVRELA